MCDPLASLRCIATWTFRCAIGISALARIVARVPALPRGVGGVSSSLHGEIVANDDGASSKCGKPINEKQIYSSLRR